MFPIILIIIARNKMSTSSAYTYSWTVVMQVRVFLITSTQPTRDESQSALADLP